MGRIRARLREFYDRRGPGNAPLGRTGERLAERYIKRSGYRLLARNFRAAGAEIDLIAAEKDTIVFIEVKTRRSTGAGRPEEAVDDRKQARIRRAAEIYLDRHRAHGAAIRFDVVAITGRDSDRRVELFRDAF
jgi:putative endonuclease